MYNIVHVHFIFLYCTKQYKNISLFLLCAHFLLVCVCGCVLYRGIWWCDDCGRCLTTLPAWGPAVCPRSVDHCSLFLCSSGHYLFGSVIFAFLFHLDRWITHTHIHYSIYVYYVVDSGCYVLHLQYSYAFGWRIYIKLATIFFFVCS